MILLEFEKVYQSARDGRVLVLS